MPFYVMPVAPLHATNVIMLAIVMLYSHVGYLPIGESPLRDARLFRRQSVALQAVRADGSLPILHDRLPEFNPRSTASKALHVYTPRPVIYTFTT